MGEDRALMVVFASGSTRWAIERANGKLEYMMPLDGPIPSEAQREWVLLWRKHGGKAFCGWVR